MKATLTLFLANLCMVAIMYNQGSYKMMALSAFAAGVMLNQIVRYYLNEN